VFSAFSHYYELKSENKLPPNTVVTDPIDNTTFRVETTDNLDSLCEKLNESRKKKGFTVMSKDHMKTLFLITLVEQTPPHLIDTYFKPVAIPPQFGQIISLARAVVHEWKSDQSTSTVQRQNRAKHCLVCPLHRRSGQAPTVPPNLLDRFGFASLAQSMYYPEEDQLGACGMCGCNLQLKVKVNIRACIASLTPENLDLILNMFGSNAFSVCWMLKEGIENADTKRILQAKMRNGRADGEQKLHQYLSVKADEALKG
jgi:hypothetical protein